MTVKIVFCNRRGGVGKTLTAYNVAYDLAKLHNKKVLLIDGDPQKSLSFIAGANLESNVQLYSAVLIKDLAGNIQRGK